MKKKTLILLAAALLFLLGAAPARAAALPQADQWYGDLWDSVDANTKELLGQLGLEGVSAEGLLSLTPAGVLRTVAGIVKGEAASPLRYCAASVLLLAVASLAASFLPEGGAMRQRCETVGRLCVMFALLSGAGQALRDSMPAVTATEDFILALVPVFTGILGFAGSPALALSWGGAVLAFAETVGAFFAKYVPALGALGTAACAAANLNTQADLSGTAKLLAKTVTVAMGFAAGLFTAVLSVKEVVAGAADTVGMKGAKFLIGQGVPIVGSAVADALNSVAAGLGLIRNTVGAFAAAVLLLIDLAPVLRLLLWKFVFRFLTAAGELLGQSRTASLTESLNSLLSVMLAVICFNSAVFIVALAVVLRAKGG